MEKAKQIGSALFYFVHDSKSHFERKDLAIINCPKKVALREEVYLRSFIMDFCIANFFHSDEKMMTAVRDVFWSAWIYHAQKKSQKMFGATYEECVKRLKQYSATIKSDSRDWFYQLAKEFASNLNSAEDIYVVMLGAVIISGGLKFIPDLIKDLYSLFSRK